MKKKSKVECTHNKTKLENNGVHCAWNSALMCPMGNACSRIKRQTDLFHVIFLQSVLFCVPKLLPPNSYLIHRITIPGDYWNIEGFPRRDVLLCRIAMFFRIGATSTIAQISSGHFWSESKQVLVLLVSGICLWCQVFWSKPCAILRYTFLLTLIPSSHPNLVNSGAGQG